MALNPAQAAGAARRLMEDTKRRARAAGIPDPYLVAAADEVLGVSRSANATAAQLRRELDDTRAHLSEAQRVGLAAIRQARTYALRLERHGEYVGGGHLD